MEGGQLLSMTSAWQLLLIASVGLSLVSSSNGAMTVVVRYRSSTDNRDVGCAINRKVDERDEERGREREREVERERGRERECVCVSVSVCVCVSMEKLWG